MAEFFYKIGHVGLHYGEEPTVSGSTGSGTVFFSGCSMHCVFCQNYPLSQQRMGTLVSERQLIDYMLKLEAQGACNINLVSPSHYVKALAHTLPLLRKELKIPLVYNTGGYDRVENLRLLDGLIDVYLTDIKYFSDEYALKYSGATNYGQISRDAFLEMKRQQPEDLIEEGLLKKGVIVRYLLLPTLLEDGKKVLDYVAAFDKNTTVSLMSQYVPCGKADLYPEINRRITHGQYESLCEYARNLGLNNGFFQSFESASKEFIPNFNLIS